MKYCNIFYTKNNFYVLGQKFAQFEAKVVLSNIVRTLNITTSLTKEEIKVSPEMISRPHKKIYLSFVPLEKYNLLEKYSVLEKDNPRGKW